MAPQKEPSKNYIRDLHANDVVNLTSLLSSTNQSPSWQTLQSRSITKLKPSNSAILKPTSLLSSFSTALLHHNTAVAFLCTTHKPLHPRLIRRVFLQLAQEVTDRIANLQKYQTTNPLAEDVKAWLGRMQAINSLWMTPSLYRVVYTAQPEDQRYRYVEGGCEACILAYVGGSMQILLDLQVAAISRRRSKKDDPIILRFLDEWLVKIGASEYEAGNLAFAQEVRDVRKEARKMRKGTGGEKVPRYSESLHEGRPSEITAQEPRYEHNPDEVFPPSSLTQSINTGLSRFDFGFKDSHEQVEDTTDALDQFDFRFQDRPEPENEEGEQASIIEYYSDRMSRLDLNDLVGGMHPAFRDSARSSIYSTAPTRPLSGPLKRGAYDSSSYHAPTRYNPAASRVPQGRSGTPTDYNPRANRPLSSRNADSIPGLSEERKKAASIWTDITVPPTIAAASLSPSDILFSAELKKEQDTEFEKLMGMEPEQYNALKAAEAKAEKTAKAKSSSSSSSHHRSKTGSIKNKSHGKDKEKDKDRKGKGREKPPSAMHNTKGQGSHMEANAESGGGEDIMRGMRRKSIGEESRMSGDTRWSAFQ